MAKTSQMHACLVSKPEPRLCSYLDFPSPSYQVNMVLSLILHKRANFTSIQLGFAADIEFSLPNPPVDHLKAFSTLWPQRLEDKILAVMKTRFSNVKYYLHFIVTIHEGLIYMQSYRMKGVSY